MKRHTFFNIILILSILVIGFNSCDTKDEPANKKPTCSISSPDNGTEFVGQDTITISVDATDSDGEISEVIFFANGEILDIDYTAPYIYHWLIEDVSAGDHSIRASSHDDEGGSATDEVAIKIIHNAKAPIADFHANKYEGQAPLFLHFIDDSTNEPTSWEWDFGDGNTSTSQSPYHTYHEAGSFTVTLTATNSFGTDSKTEEDYIITLPGGHIAPFTDARDGQVYDSIQIGNQTWMTSNLNWDSPEGSWDYEDNSSYGEIYGKLYNFTVARTACPDGWHLPKDSEWKTLEKYIGMSSTEADRIGWRGVNEGGELKTAGTEFWESPNHGANNAAYFYALPGGQYFNGYFGDKNFQAYFWTGSSNGDGLAFYRKLSYDSPQVGRSGQGDREYGFSVRCIKTPPES